jgi:hypothetical protein
MMKLIPKLLLVVAIAATSITASAQRIKLLEGDLSVLKGQKSINTEFTWDNIKVGSYDKEADYVQKKTDDYNKKEAGRGDTWAKAWESDKMNRFAPKFNELFSDNSDMKAGTDKNAKYTLIFKTSFLEPGYNIGISRKNASMDGEAWIVETADHSKVIAKISVDKAQGRIFGGFDFDTGVRLAEAYADAAKALGKFINKKM